MTAPSAANLAAEVDEFLAYWNKIDNGGLSVGADRCRDALAALLARCEEAERDVRNIRAAYLNLDEAVGEWRNRAEAAEAEREEMRGHGLEWKKRALAAEAERDEARETNRVNSEMAVWKHELWKSADALVKALADDRVTLKARVAELGQALRDLDHQVLRACQRLPMTYFLATEKDYPDDHSSQAGVILRRALDGSRAALQSGGTSQQQATPSQRWDAGVQSGGTTEDCPCGGYHAHIGSARGRCIKCGGSDSR